MNQQHLSVFHLRIAAIGRHPAAATSETAPVCLGADRPLGRSIAPSVPVGQHESHSRQ